MSKPMVEGVVDSNHILLPVSSMPRTKRKFLRGRSRLVSQIVTGLIILGCWQLVGSSNLVQPVLRASPEQVVSFLIQSVGNGVLLPNLWSTLEATVIAFVLGSGVGITVGIGLALLPRVEGALDPYLNALNSMPRIALAPLFVLYFGFGTLSKVVLAFSLVVFILITNARAGVLGVDREFLRLCSAFDATKWQIVRKILLPASVPSIFAGLRLGLVYALLGVVTSELIGSQEGLGSRISFYSAAFQMQGIYGILIILALIGMLLNGLMALAERRLLRWQGSEGGGR